MALRPRFVNVPDPDRRLRVGYISPDFRRGPLAAFIEPVLAAHDPSQVEVFAYAELARADEVTERLQSLVHSWRRTRDGGDDQVADQIRADKIDILVDLAGHTANHRLGVFARKPAPVQVTYLGYAGTTGLGTVDFRLTDAIADPAGEPAHHVEEVVRLPGCFCCYAPPTDAPEIGPYTEHHPVTFGSPHKLIKLNDRVIELWARVLQVVPNSRLLLCRNTLNGETLTYWRRRVESHGIAHDRVELRQAVQSAEGYLATYQEMDVLLDVFPWTGHAVTCEALWMGVPVVTLLGDRFAGRMSASVLTSLGLTDLVATNADQYVTIAARLANDRSGLARLRSELRERMRESPLCDAGRFTKGLEESYRWMWRRWCMQQTAQAAINET
jgi:predicted O-linked N-acetylglucosamine transferase (SPINDLY family)